MFDLRIFGTSQGDVLQHSGLVHGWYKLKLRPGEYLCLGNFSGEGSVGIEERTIINLNTMGCQFNQTNVRREEGCMYTVHSSHTIPVHTITRNNLEKL
jgi:hypothetical protein